MAAPVIEQREVGASGVAIPRIALGCGNFGGVGSSPALFDRGVDEAGAFALMDAAWESGLTHFDTADAYGGGRSEAMIGRWIRARGVRPVITTKTFNPMDAGGDHGLAPRRVIRQLQSSLERLGVDHVDIYLAHDLDPDVAPQSVAETFAGLREQGLVRAIGVSNYNAAALREALAAGPVDAIQNARSLLERADDAELLDLCAARSVSYVAYSPLAGGWLTGKYRRGEPYPAGSRMTMRPEPYGAFSSQAVFDALERLRALAAQRGCSMAAVALAWLLADERVAAIVVGPTSVRQLEPVAEALANPLAEAERDALTELFSR